MAALRRGGVVAGGVRGTCLKPLLPISLQRRGAARCARVQVRPIFCDRGCVDCDAGAFHTGWPAGWLALSAERRDGYGWVKRWGEEAIELRYTESRVPRDGFMFSRRRSHSLCLRLVSGARAIHRVERAARRERGTDECPHSARSRRAHRRRTYCRVRGVRRRRYWPRELLRRRGLVARALQLQPLLMQ